jgi:hypothetical protein
MSSWTIRLLPPRWEKVSFSISSLEPQSILTFGRMHPKSHYLIQRVFNIRARAARKGAPEAISLLEEVVKIQEQTLAAEHHPAVLHFSEYGIVRLQTLQAHSIQRLLQRLIPYSGCLFEPIERLQELADEVGIEHCCRKLRVDVVVDLPI